MADWSDERILESIERLSLNPGEPIRVYWCTTSRNRTQVARGLTEGRGSTLLAPHILDQPNAFRSANALRRDIHQVLECERLPVERLLDGCPPRSTSPLCLVIVSRDPLQISSGTDSLVALPEWIAGVGGRELPIRIEDIEALADAPLDAPEARMEDLSTRLYELELLLQSCVAVRLVRARDDVEGLLQQMREEGETSDQLLEKCRATISRVTAPTAFRPSCGIRETSLIGRLSRLVSSRAPEKLPKTGLIFCRAIGICEDGMTDLEVPQPLVAILYRSAYPLDEPLAVLGDAALRTIYGACQYITAAHHADSYPRYPLSIIQATSRDLRLQLDRFNRLVRLMELA